VAAMTTATTTAIIAEAIEGVGGPILLRQRRVDGGAHVWREVHDGGDVSDNGQHLRPHVGGGEGCGQVDRSCGDTHGCSREGRAYRRVDARGGARGSAGGGARGCCNGQGTCGAQGFSRGGVRDEDCGGAHDGTGEGQADRRVGSCGGGAHDIACGAPAPVARSRETAWMVAMAAARAAEAAPAAAKATTTVSVAGEGAMTKTKVDQG
jgi:hypothetical protein